MTRLGTIWTAMAFVSFSVCMSQAGFADTHSSRSVTKQQLQRPVLRSLTPEVDLSNEPDPADVFDQAVKEYTAGRLPKAEKLFQQVIELDPTNADAHFNMGAIKEWRNDLPSALEHYKAAIKAKPRDSEIAEAIKAVEYKIKNRTVIEAQTAKLTKERELATHSKLAKEAFSAQNYADAIIHLNYLADAVPEDPKIQFALGQSLRALKNFDWAAYRLKMAIYLDPDNDLYRKTLVELDKEMQDIQSQAYTESADMAVAHLFALQSTQFADVGARHEF